MPAGSGIQLKCPECGGYHAAPEDAAFNDLLRTACAEVGVSTQRVYSAFDIGSRGGRWDTDDEAGIIRWTHADGRRVRADYGFVGTWIEETGSFMWAWGKDQVAEATVGPARMTHAYGEAEGHAVLTTLYLDIEAQDAWHLTNICAHLAGRPGSYRAKVNAKAWAYFVFSEPEWEH